jgi:predicted nucleotidyltransferase
MKLSSTHIKTIRRYFSGLPVKRAYLFGSYARNEPDENSDIDILVELDHASPIGMQFFTYAEGLQNILKKKVDIVSDEGLSKYVKPFIDRDKVLIYER